MNNQQRDAQSTIGDRLPSRCWIVLIAFLLVTAPLGVVAAWQLGPNAGSPATGHAQVITQGIAALSQEPVVWRLVERTAEPRGQARFGERILGFVLASEEPVLLTDETARGPADVARLAPGEAFFVRAGTRQMRSSLTGQPVAYLSLELAPATVADQVGSGTLLFATDPFTPGAGDRDVDLVRDVLALQETTIIPDQGQPTVVLASEGAIEVVPSIGRSRTLQPGEVAIFDGELAIQAVPASGVNASRPMQLLSGFTQPDSIHDQQAATGAAFVAGVIGPEIPPVSTPTPTVTIAVPPPVSEPPTAEVSPTPTEIGGIRPEPTVEVSPTRTRPGSVIIPTPGSFTLPPTPTQGPEPEPEPEPAG